MSDPRPISDGLDDGPLSRIAAIAKRYPPVAPVDELPTTNRHDAWLSVCPRRFHKATLAGLDHPEATEMALSGWVDEAIPGEAPNLVLLGPVGRGKTYAALACARSVYLEGQSVSFVPVVEMLDALRPEGGGSPATYIEPDVLVLDDLGGEKPSEWTVERLYLVINRRWLDCKPTIATTNLEPDQLREAMGERVVDRLRDGAVVLRLGGESSRRGQI